MYQVVYPAHLESTAQEQANRPQAERVQQGTTAQQKRSLERVTLAQQETTVLQGLQQ